MTAARSLPRAVLLMLGLAISLIRVAPGAAQSTATPALSGGRVLGELAGGLVGTGVAMITTATVYQAFHRTDSATKHRARVPSRTAFLVMGVTTGAGAAAGAWLVSRRGDQTSDLALSTALSVGASTAAFALLHRSITKAKGTSVRRRIPIQVGALVATLVATATREAR